jgi:hypothetical protein
MVDCPPPPIIISHITPMAESVWREIQEESVVWKETGARKGGLDDWYTEPIG